MSEVFEKIKSSAAQIRQITDFKPELALILGSGLGGFADTGAVECRVPYSEIKGFPLSTVSGHKGEFVFKYIGGVPVVIMQGRVHYYEGYDITDVVMPVRVMALLGAKTLFLTNAAGAVNESFNVGELMLITDHITSFVPSPLIGANIDELGVRFPDMSKIYTPELQDAITETAEEEDITLRHGVYVQTTGPAYETPAEIRMFRTLGADAVGMSTAIEAMAARHVGMKVCGISMLSNMAAGILDKPLTHGEIKDAADKAAPMFTRLLEKSIPKLAKIK